MTRFQIAIERIADSRRFQRAILAANEAAALRQANALLSGEAQDYYVVAIVAA